MKDFLIAILIALLAFGFGYYFSGLLNSKDAIEHCDSVLQSCDKDEGVEIVSTFSCRLDKQQLLYIEPIYSCPDKKVKSIILSGQYNSKGKYLDLNLVAGRIGD